MSKKCLKTYFFALFCRKIWWNKKKVVILREFYR